MTLLKKYDIFVLQKLKGEKKMYLKNKNKTLTIRLSPEQYAYLKGTADSFGVTPSQWIRIIIDTVRSGNNENIEIIRDGKL